MPSAAWARPMVSVVWRLSPSRSKRGSGVTARCTKSEPLGPPRWPAAPRSASRSVEPSSTPAGTSTVKVLSSMRRPSPRQSGQGCGIISPVPPQREQATLVTTWPSSDWRTRRSSPVPWQSTQVSGSVPGAVPRPAQAVHMAGRRTEISLWQPKTASANSRSRRTSASAPACGPRRRPPSSRHLAEEGLEDVAQTALEAEAAHAAGLARRTRPRDRSGRSGRGARGRAAPRRRRSPA